MTTSPDPAMSALRHLWRMGWDISLGSDGWRAVELTTGAKIDTRSLDTLVAICDTLDSEVLPQLERPTLIGPGVYSDGTTVL